LASADWYGASQALSRDTRADCSVVALTAGVDLRRLRQTDQHN
jgi:hypothetical protein